MSSHYIVPTFNKSTPNKVHNQLTVTGQNTVSHPTTGAWISAISTESIPATVDGEYIFVVRVDNIVSANIMIGVTSMETFDSSKESWPGYNGMTGSAVHLPDGNHYPNNSPNLIAANISRVAKEIIIVVTIAGNGAQKLVRWIVSGTSSANHDCTAHCVGNQLFALVGPCDQNQQITTIPINQVTIRTGEVPALLKKYEDSLLPPLPPPTSLLMKEALADNFPDQLALKLRRDIVHSVLFGLAGAGKSTVFNFINYVLHGGKFAGGRPTGESAVVGGQFSTQCIREESSFHLEWDVKQKGDLLLTDTVGFTGDESELAAIGNGKLKEVEAWPRDNSEASNFKRVEILNRPPQTARPTCFVLFISADQLMNKNDKANDAIVNSVLEAAKTKFRAGEFQVEIPLMIVVGKVDKMESNPTKEDLLLQRTSPKLNGIFKACHERFGVAQDDIFALGFMDESDVTDFSPTTKDPRVLTVRHLLLRIAEGAQICAKRFKKHEQSTSPSSPASPNQTAQKNKNGNDDDDEQQKQFAAVAAAYGCANPLVVVAGHGEPSVTDATGIHHKSVSENGNNNNGAPTVESIAAADAEKKRQIAYFEDQMSKAGSNKAYVETLNKDNLRALLICKNVAEAVVKAIFEGDCSGLDFVDDSFVETVFDDETKKKYNISKMNMVSFNKVRDALNK